MSFYKRYFIPLFVVCFCIVSLPFSTNAATQYEHYWSSSDDETYKLDLRVSTFDEIVYTPDIAVGSNMFPWPARYYPVQDTAGIHIEVGKLGYYEITGTATTTVYFRFLKQPILYEDYDKGEFVMYVDGFDVSDLAMASVRVVYSIDGGDQLYHRFSGSDIVSAPVGIVGFGMSSVGLRPSDLTIEQVYLELEAGVTIDATVGFAFYKGDSSFVPPVYLKSFYGITSETYTQNYNRWVHYSSPDTNRQYIQSTFEISVTVPLYSYHDYYLDFDFGFVFGQWAADGSDGWLKLVDVYTWPSVVEVVDERVTLDRGDIPDLPYPSNAIQGAVPHWAKIEAVLGANSTSMLPEYVTIYFTFALDPVPDLTYMSFISANNDVFYFDFSQQYTNTQLQEILDLMNRDYIVDPEEKLLFVGEKKEELQQQLDALREQFRQQEADEEAFRQQIQDYISVGTVDSFTDVFNSIILDNITGFEFWQTAMNHVFVFVPAQHLVIASAFSVGLFMILRIVASVGSGVISGQRRAQSEAQSAARQARTEAWRQEIRDRWKRGK